ncbi:hypothetical protein [Streptomyces naganishii]|uniref:hypothetical protein n=1 Tax=Streptomyces naganishii TaxID=285447 RepID=UPI001E342D83|nr:hypothetical protein [Streptomyces naganishii]
MPLVSVLLLVMDRIEDRMLDPAPLRGRHAGQRRHLRLIPGGRRGTGDDEDSGDFEDAGDAGEVRRAA